VNALGILRRFNTLPTTSGLPCEEVLLSTESGSLVAGFAVHGPRTSIVATLDWAPDRDSVATVRESIYAISFQQER
jgi:hypothetical protein